MSSSRPLSPALALVAACCRWPRSDDRVAAIRSAVQNQIDWSIALQIAERHRVEPLVMDGLRQAKIPMPLPVRDALAGSAAKAARNSLTHAAQSWRLRNLFDAAEVRLLFVKGETLGMLAYGQLGLKKGKDIDLLVDPVDFGRAGAILAAEGYVQIQPDPKMPAAQASLYAAIENQTVWRNHRTGVIIDLHRRLINSRHLIPAIGIHSPTQEVAIAPGRSLPTLAWRELFIYLCAHGALCGWMRLKWLADVAALLGQRSEQEIKGLYHWAQAQGAERCAGQAMLLCHRLLGTALPDQLIRRIEKDRAVQLLEQVALTSLAGAGGGAELSDRPATARAVLFSRLLLARSWRFKVDIARERWISMADRQQIKLPPPLSFLYHLLRIPLFFWRARPGAARPR